MEIVIKMWPKNNLKTNDQILFKNKTHLINAEYGKLGYITMPKYQIKNS